MPFYRVKQQGVATDRLVKADTPAGALRHAAATVFTVAKASQDELVELMGEGVKVEDAGAEPAATAPASE